MKREYFIITESPIESHGWMEMHGKSKMIVFPVFGIREEPIFSMLIEVAPRLIHLENFRNIQLSLEESSILKNKLINWVQVRTLDKPSAKPGEICSFQIGDRFVILNLRNVYDAEIHLYLKGCDIIKDCIIAGKPTLVSLLDHT